MKSRKEMLLELKDFQNEKFRYEIMDEEAILDFCVQITYEIFIEKKHKYEPDLKRIKH
ncbi:MULTISPECIES: hypothetical protein [Bacillus]|jgi:hypothetical protein|uniref:hypothetical protein n=1 Tax=Bacillus TaxID=1386 RepID=UPI0015EC639D|nr:MULTISPECIES: hypothetical protein [Bacillus]WJE64885.1 hypothetical protein QRE63_02770 [Bacillus mycoides]